MAASLSTIAADSYLALVIKFPLIAIRNERHLDRALAVIDRLIAEELDEGQQDYLDALTDLVGVYEDRHHGIPDAPESDVLDHLMRTHGLSQSELGRQTAIAPSTISSILSGSRNLTRSQIEAVARFFNVSPAAFLPAR